MNTWGRSDGSSTAQMSSIAFVIKNIEKNMIQPGGTSNPLLFEPAYLTCVFCGEEHKFEDCPANPTSVCYMGSRNPPYQNHQHQGHNPHSRLTIQGGGIITTSLSLDRVIIMLQHLTSKDMKIPTTSSQINRGLNHLLPSHQTHWRISYRHLLPRVIRECRIRMHWFRTKLIHL